MLFAELNFSQGNFHTRRISIKKEGIELGFL